jgi:hypothetical protein
MSTAAKYWVQFQIGHFLVTVCNNKHDVVELTVCFHSCGTPCNCVNPFRCSHVDILLSELKSYLEDAIKLKHLDPTTDSKQRHLSNPKVNHDTVESWLALARWLMVNPIPVKCVPGLYVCLCSYSTQLFYPYEIILGGGMNMSIMQHYEFSRRLYDMYVVQQKLTVPNTLNSDLALEGTSGLHTIRQPNNNEYTTHENVNTHKSVNALIKHVFTKGATRSNNTGKKNATWVMKNRDNLMHTYTHGGFTLTATQILNNAPFAVEREPRGFMRLGDHEVYAIATSLALTSHREYAGILT